MRFGLNPIANMPVYKRVAIGADPQPGGLTLIVKSTADICLEIYQRSQQERIWQCVVDTASGTNVPTSSPSSTGSPTDCDDIVCTDGWEAA